MALASWAFFGGMLLLAAQCLLESRVAQAVGTEQAASRQALALTVRAFSPAVWLCFSLVYCRGNRREFLRRWRFVLLAALLLPPALAFGFHGRLIDAAGVSRQPDGWQIGLLAAGKALVLILLLFEVLILVNLEKTFRAAVGLARWRVKYLFLGAGLMVGAKFYTLSQALVFSGFAPGPAVVEAAALLLGCSLMGIGYARKGFGEFGIYPSRAVLQGSVTVVLAGAYLLVVGLLARWARPADGGASLPAQALIVLVGVASLAILLLSDRLRAGLRRFVSRHFSRPQHDYRAVWTEFSRRTSGVRERDELCRLVSGLVSETFEALNVSLLLADGSGRGMVFVPPGTGEGKAALQMDAAMVEALANRSKPFDLETERSPWAAGLRSMAPVQFGHGGPRMAVPLVTGNRLLGIMILADRVKGMAYTHEELDLLKCMADQLAATLLNDTLAEQLRQATELEAFQTMSTFFVHDLKNAANSLNMMLQNLPVHFDDPEFRADALRGIGGTVDRINLLVAKLAGFRRNLRIEGVDTDLNDLVGDVIDGLKADLAGVELSRHARSLPKVRIDPDGIRSVVTNLLVNAREAVGNAGRVRVETQAENSHVTLSITDNGHGMSPDYIANDLFRPFRSTRSKGLGIGMFQCRMIVEAHMGSIQVESTPGTGTTFRVTLPQNLQALGLR